MMSIEKRVRVSARPIIRLQNLRGHLQALSNVIQEENKVLIISAADTEARKNNEETTLASQNLN